MLYIYICNIYIKDSICINKEKCYTRWKSISNCQQLRVLQQKWFPPTIPKYLFDDL